MSSDQFISLNLQPEMQKALDSLGFVKMTEIQAAALPQVLAGSDVIAQAQTGSGKTVAFGLGVLSTTKISDCSIQSLILCPTRELAAQVAAEIRRLGRFFKNLKVVVLCGGTPLSPQSHALEYGAHIVVGTPGRILDHLKKKTLQLSTIKTLVLDEADRMLDMGFADDIRDIINRTPRSRQTLLFSATFPDSIKAMSEGIQKNPTQVGTKDSALNHDIEQLFFAAPNGAKETALLSLLKEYKPESSIVFCATKIQCDEIANYLCKHGVVALAIHGDLEQSMRTEVLVRFANQSAAVLVATDVAARGLDVKDLSAVINFEISKDPEVHVHRIGRTGRAGKKGLSLSLCTPSEMRRVQAIETYCGKKLPITTFTTKAETLSLNLKPAMVTLKISGGKKNKLRPGDILGALIKDVGIKGPLIGKIDIFDFHSYVAINKSAVDLVKKQLSAFKIKTTCYKLKII